MAVKLAPNPRQQFEDSNGNPYVGGKLFTYAAGSSTKQATYTDSTGLTANTNPIILDSAGRTPYGVWLTAGLNYKFVLAPSTDTDPPSSPIFTEDVVSGVNDTATTVSQWTASAATPTYISATTFSLVGDKTADFHVGRRVKFTVTAGTVYGLITVSAYTTLTTVTVVMDSGALDTGLSAVELSILTSTGPSIPKLSVSNLNAIGIQPLDATITAYAGTLTAANKIPYATATDVAGELTRDIDGTLAANSDTNIATQKAVKTYADAKVFESVQQVITSAGTLTIAHGLGAAPRLLQPWLVNITSEHGYSVGDKVAATLGVQAGTVSSSVSTVVDATNINIRYADNVAAFNILHKTTGAPVSATNANWRFVIAAYK